MAFGLQAQPHIRSWPKSAATTSAAAKPLGAATDKTRATWQNQKWSENHSISPQIHINPSSNQHPKLQPTRPQASLIPCRIWWKSANLWPIYASNLTNQGRLRAPSQATQATKRFSGQKTVLKRFKPFWRPKPTFSWDAGLLKVLPDVPNQKCPLFVKKKGARGPNQAKNIARGRNQVKNIARSCSQVKNIARGCNPIKNVAQCRNQVKNIARGYNHVKNIARGSTQEKKTSLEVVISALWSLMA